MKIGIWLLGSCRRRLSLSTSLHHRLPGVLVLLLLLLLEVLLMLMLLMLVMMMVHTA